MNDSGERTEAPTARRLARARAQGRWGQSAWATSCIVTLLAVMPAVAATHVGADWIALWRATARSSSAVADAHFTWHSFHNTWVFWKGGWFLVATAWIAACLAAIAASAASGALGFAPGALQWRFDRLSWRAGVQQLANSEGVIAASTALCGSLLVVWSAWPAARKVVELAAAGVPLISAVAIVRDALCGAWWWLVFVLGLLAIFDVWRLRRRMVRALHMSPREVRDDRAETEGRPDLRARRRATASRTMRSVNASAIRLATAVIANPAHIAVALRYAPPRIDVPIVVSRGADLAAVLVRTIAGLHDVPIIESPELARALFARATLGEPIPEDCYAAVAAVFALLLQTRGLLRRVADG